MCPCWKCKDGWLLTRDGWDECWVCHGTTFALPPFPSEAQLASANALRQQREGRNAPAIAL